MCFRFQIHPVHNRRGQHCVLHKVNDEEILMTMSDEEVSRRSSRPGSVATAGRRISFAKNIETSTGAQRERVDGGTGSARAHSAAAQQVPGILRPANQPESEGSALQSLEDASPVHITPLCTQRLATHFVIGDAEEEDEPGSEAGSPWPPPLSAALRPLLMLFEALPWGSNKT